MSRSHHTPRSHGKQDPCPGRCGDRRREQPPGVVLPTSPGPEEPEGSCVSPQALKRWQEGRWLISLQPKPDSCLSLTSVSWSRCACCGPPCTHCPVRGEEWKRDLGAETEPALRLQHSVCQMGEGRPQERKDEEAEEAEHTAARPGRHAEGSGREAGPRGQLQRAARAGAGLNTRLPKPETPQEGREGLESPVSAQNRIAQDSFRLQVTEPDPLRERREFAGCLDWTL